MVSSIISFMSFGSLIALLLAIGLGIVALEDPGVKFSLTGLILLGVLSSLVNLGSTTRIEKQVSAFNERFDTLEKKLEPVERLATIALLKGREE